MATGLINRHRTIPYPCFCAECGTELNKETDNSVSLIFYHGMRSEKSIVVFFCAPGCMHTHSKKILKEISRYMAFKEAEKETKDNDIDRAIEEDSL